MVHCVYINEYRTPLSPRRPLIGLSRNFTREHATSLAWKWSRSDVDCNFLIKVTRENSLTLTVQQQRRRSPAATTTTSSSSSSIGLRPALIRHVDWHAHRRTDHCTRDSRQMDLIIHGCVILTRNLNSYRRSSWRSRQRLSQGSSITIHQHFHVPAKNNRTNLAVASTVDLLGLQ